MKSFLNKLFHLLGSVHFAVTLIGTTVLFVICGTLIESKTTSHLFAEYYTYKHPAFLTLLCFFFINILFAALRRWPFKVRHIPFLITHLGLLMVLAGAILKEQYGIQGAMQISEGSGSHHLFLNETQVVRIEKRGVSQENDNTIGEFNLDDKKSPFAELQAEVIGYTPHCSERLETWIKGDLGVISGLKPFAIPVWKTRMDPMPFIGKIRLYQEPEELWNLLACKTSNIVTAATKAFIGETIVTIKNRKEEVLYQGPLQNSLEKEIVWKGGMAKLELHLNFSPINGFENPTLMAILIEEFSKRIIEVPLNGAEALVNKVISKDHLKSPPITIDLLRTPTLVLIQDPQEDNYLFAFGPNGNIYSQIYRSDNLTTLVSYEEGFGGYAAPASIPFWPQNESRENKEKAVLDSLREELSRATVVPGKLAPPLQCFHHACQIAEVDFAETCVAFLKEWDQCCSWLIPDDIDLPHQVTLALQSIDWKGLPLNEKKAAFWCGNFFSDLEPLLQRGLAPKEILASKQWPLPFPSDMDDPQDFLSLVTQQIFSIGDLLPETDPDIFPASALSAYFRVYGIHLTNISPPLELINHQQEDVVLETPLTLKLINQPPLTKIEDNVPAVTVKFKEGTKEQTISLPYKRSAQGLKWPVLSGEYLARFQPSQLPIHHHVRLQQARQINYLNQNQPFSYEADIAITDLRNHSTEEKTISMNNVYETQDGYRFYLSNMTHSDETAVKRIQLIVNYDPGKYLLTYPGGAFITLGIILLFWFTRKTDRNL